MLAVHRRITRGTAWLTLLLASLVAGGCGDDGATAPIANLSPALTATLDSALQDEFRAEHIYLRVLADFGSVQPFHNILYAERRHSASIAALFERRGLEAPLSDWTVNSVPAFATLRAACAAGAAAELENVALYDRLLLQDLPTDVRNVFLNNRRASQENHLPAFLTCS